MICGSCGKKVNSHICDTPMCTVGGSVKTKCAGGRTSIMDYYTKQIGGNHYLTMGIQPWQIIDANDLNFYEGCVIKYILRKKDNRIEDLQKAIHVLEHMILLERQKEEE